MSVYRAQRDVNMRTRQCDMSSRWSMARAFEEISLELQAFAFNWDWPVEVAEGGLTSWAAASEALASSAWPFCADDGRVVSSGKEIFFVLPLKVLLLFEKTCISGSSSIFTATLYSLRAESSCAAFESSKVLKAWHFDGLVPSIKFVVSVDKPGKPYSTSRLPIEAAH